FIVVAGLIQVSGEEPARTVDDAADLTVGRDALHVHIEHRQEHADPWSQPVVEAQLARRWGERHVAHGAIGWGYRGPRAARRHPRGFAEERRAARGGDGAQRPGDGGEPT